MLRTFFVLVLIFISSGFGAEDFDPTDEFNGHRRDQPGKYDLLDPIRGRRAIVHGDYVDESGADGDTEKDVIEAIHEELDSWEGQAVADDDTEVDEIGAFHDRAQGTQGAQGAEETDEITKMFKDTTLKKETTVKKMKALETRMEVLDAELNSLKKQQITIRAQYTGPGNKELMEAKVAAIRAQYIGPENKELREAKVAAIRAHYTDMQDKVTEMEEKLTVIGNKHTEICEEMKKYKNKLKEIEDQLAGLAVEMGEKVSKGK